MIHDFDTLQGALINSRQRNSALGPTKELQDSKFHFVISSTQHVRRSLSRLCSAILVRSAARRIRAPLCITLRVLNAACGLASLPPPRLNKASAYHFG